MAAALGMSKSEVHRDAQAGMPMTSVEAARAWRAEHEDISRTKEGRIDRPTLFGRPHAAEESAPAVQPAAEPDDVPQPGDTAEYRKARAERERTRADREALELEQLRGRLLDGDEMGRIAYTAWRGLRDALDNVSPRIKDQLAAESDPFHCDRIVHDEISAVLASFDVQASLGEKDEEGED